MRAERRPIFTENFSANLTAIRTLLGHEGSRAYISLLDRLFDDIIPILCRFPKSGHVFLSHAVRSADAKTLVKKLGVRLRDRETLREFVVDDYLILYLIQRERLVFLSIKHHRQLSFDLRRFWHES